MTKEFIKQLEQRLKIGNLRGIHLNALPGRYATRLDLFDLVDLDPQIPQKFLQTLMNQSEFKFIISFDQTRLSEMGEEKQRHLNLISRKLNALFYENNDNYMEHGIKTFGFGYPLLIRRTQNDPSKIIKAPLLIWNLDIEKSPRKTNEWIISRSEDYPISFNSVLTSHLESDEKIQLSKLGSDVLEDGIVDQDEVFTICRNVLEQLNVPATSKDVDLKVSHCPDREQIDNLCSDVPSIIWSGICGLYRSQKESIIRDIKTLQDNFDSFTFNNLVVEKYQTSSLCGVATDPSQEEIINSLSSAHWKIIQGPPGTGKSQSLTAIITNALESGAKCLVVCEKKTALDVINNNLKEIGLETLCAVIDDVSKDRKSIIDAARTAIDSAGNYRVTFRVNEHEEKCRRYGQLKTDINAKYHAVVGQILGDDRWKDIIGRYLRAEKTVGKEVVEKALDMKEYDFSYEEFKRLKDLVLEGQNLFANVGSLEHPLDILSQRLFGGAYSIAMERRVKESLGQLQSRSSSLINLLRKSTTEYGSFFHRRSFLNKTFVQIYSLLSRKGKQLRDVIAKTMSEYETIIQLHEHHKLFVFGHRAFVRLKSLTELIGPLEDYAKKIQSLLDNFSSFETFFQWKSFFLKLKDKERRIIVALAKAKVSDWNSAFESWYFDGVLSKHEQLAGPFPKDSSALEEYAILSAELKKTERAKIRDVWHQRLQRSLTRFQQEKGNARTLYNYRTNNQYRSKNPLRKIIATDFQLFTDFFPVLLVNPSVCSSILPLKEGLFDIVIFDEASQLRLEDTYTSLLRGRHRIVSGDRHQMPPSNYFSGNTILADLEDDHALGDEEEEEPFDDTTILAESESLLKFADDSGYKCSYLDFHYRSRHPFLIEFSNAAFYGSRLVPMPERVEYCPIRFLQVDGVYERDGINQDEARRVVRLLSESIQPDDRGEFPSVGIATFNIHQRNFILDLIQVECSSNPTFAEKYQKLAAKGLFVKNLENIQGDERDIIIISTTFGFLADGTFRQNFGPINQQKGYRLLNVIITRAKQQLYVCTSIPEKYFGSFQNQIDLTGNVGRGIFYAYLAYAKAIEDRDDEKRTSILNLLRSKCTELGQIAQESFVESPFEQEVYEFLVPAIGADRIKPQYCIGGFRIDFVILSDSEKPVVGIECDGKHYHSSNEAYAYDMHRQQQLEQWGLKIYRIWSTNWWQKPKEEQKKLLDFIGRLYTSQIAHAQ